MFVNAPTQSREDMKELKIVAQAQFYFYSEMKKWNCREFLNFPMVPLKEFLTFHFGNAKRSLQLQNLERNFKKRRISEAFLLSPVAYH